MEVDVVIVGAGVVGLSLALVLGQQDYRVLLIEQRKDFSIPDDFEARTLALSYSSKKIFESLSVWQSLANHAVPIEQVVVSMKGQYGTTRLNTPTEYDALGYVVGANRLEQILQDKLLSLPNVKLLSNSRVISRQSTMQHWSLMIEGLNEAVSCQLLVGADGAQSQLRQEQQITSSRYDYQHFALVVNLEIPALRPFTAIERFLPKGAIALLPWQNKSVTCVITTSEEEALMLKDLSLPDFLAQCEAKLGKRLGKITKASKRYVFPLVMTLADSQCAARFLLMGNAAHNLHPIAAQGFNLSMRDIWQLHSQIIKSKARCDLGSQGFLQEYANARKTDQHRVIFATDKIAKLMSGNVIPAPLRAMGITLFDSMSPLKNGFVHFAMGLP
ncbi:MAG: FAD-dependent oxidoreductase [Candidatus Berkiella sp.]